MKKLIAILATAAAATLSACSTVDSIATGVHRYCGATTPIERLAMRERVDQQTAPHQIRVDCHVQD